MHKIHELFRDMIVSKYRFISNWSYALISCCPWIALLMKYKCCQAQPSMFSYIRCVLTGTGHHSVTWLFLCSIPWGPSSAWYSSSSCSCSSLPFLVWHCLEESTYNFNFHNLDKRKEGENNCLNKRLQALFCLLLFIVVLFECCSC